MTNRAVVHMASARFFFARLQKPSFTLTSANRLFTIEKHCGVLQGLSGSKHGFGESRKLFSNPQS